MCILRDTVSTFDAVLSKQTSALLLYTQNICT